MPYIQKARREELDWWLRSPENPGELNFLYYSIAKRYFEKHPNYQGINDIIGALEGAKLEFARRFVSDFEDAAIQRNGDI